MRKNWAILREAFAGSERDFTSGSIRMAIFLLAVPMILEMLMESIFAIVDIFFVAKLGAQAVAVVGLTESMLAIVFALSIGLSVGATATVARRTGEQDPEGAARAAVHCIYLGVIASLVISALGIAFAPQFLAALGGGPDVVRMGTPFTRIMLGGNAVIVFLFLLNAIFRGAGDASVAMRVLFWANGLNIILTPCFIFGPDLFAVFKIDAPAWLVQNWPFPRMDVTGAAVSTTIGRGVGVLLAAWYLLKPGGRITIRREYWKFDPALFASLLKIAAPAICSSQSQPRAGAPWCASSRALATRPSRVTSSGCASSSSSAARRGPEQRRRHPCRAELGAASPSAPKPRCGRRLRQRRCLGTVGLALLFFSRTIVSWFTVEPGVLDYGASALHIVSFGFVFYAFGLTFEASFNGAGDTWTPTFLNLLVFWVLEIRLPTSSPTSSAWGQAASSGLSPSPSPPSPSPPHWCSSAASGSTRSSEHCQAAGMYLLLVSSVIMSA
jgi:Na+-driven multidrug efflux pump